MSRLYVGGGDAVLIEPSGQPQCAVLVLAGSSGRIDEPRVRVLAGAGAVALSMQWFGGPGQPAGICEVPLESFSEALALLDGYGVPVAVVGSSKGAEAALLLATTHDRLRAVIAFAPTDVVWAEMGGGADGHRSPPRSSWTRGGRPLPFVPYSSDWVPDREPPAFLDWYVQSRQADPARTAAAAIPVETYPGEVVLVAGGDDQVWDSAASAERLAARRGAVGLRTRVIMLPTAGHRTVLPGEPATAPGQAMERGGSPSADAELGRLAWSTITEVLGLAAPAERD